MRKNMVQLFNNEELGLQIRVIENTDGSISMNAEDTIRGFGFVKVDRKNGKEYVRLDMPRVQRYISEMTFGKEFPKLMKDDYIPESLFYRLGMKANNTVAQKFQGWIADDVIPSIRKTGSYTISNDNKDLVDVAKGIMNNPRALAEVFNQLADALDAKQLAEEEKEKALIEMKNAIVDKNDAINKKIIAEAKRDILIHNDKTYTATELAKECGFRSATKFNTKLAELKVQFKQGGAWLLYAKYAGKGYTETKQTTLENGYIVYTTKWTGKGRAFILDLLKITREESNEVVMTKV